MEEADKGYVLVAPKTSRTPAISETVQNCQDFIDLLATFIPQLSLVRVISRFIGNGLTKKLASSLDNFEIFKKLLALMIESQRLVDATSPDLKSSAQLKDLVDCLDQTKERFSEETVTRICGVTWYGMLNQVLYVRTDKLMIEASICDINTAKSALQSLIEATRQELNEMEAIRLQEESRKRLKKSMKARRNKANRLSRALTSTDRIRFTLGLVPILLVLVLIFLLTTVPPESISQLFVPMANQSKLMCPAWFRLNFISRDNN